MICPTCAEAAARRAPRDQHCTDPTCPCGHRADRYRPASLYDQIMTLILAELPWAPPAPTSDACPCGGTTTEHAPDCPIHPARLRAAESAAAALLPAEARAAGLHFEYATEAAAFIGTDALLQSHLRAQAEALAADTWRQMVHGPATCAATLTSPFGAGALHCAQAAGHYDETTEPIFGTDGWATDPGGWHWAGPRTAVWADTADGATPHTDTTKD